MSSLTIGRKRPYDLFAANYGKLVPIDPEIESLRLQVKIRDEYEAVGHFTAPTSSATPSNKPSSDNSLSTVPVGPSAPKPSTSQTSKLLDTLPLNKPAAAQSSKSDQALTLYSAPPTGPSASASAQRAVMAVINDAGSQSSAAVSRRIASKWPRPEWRAPWQLYRVISGHLGWVRSLAIDPTNDWFATGSADRTIKIWDLASGQLKLTLTGHIEQVTGLAVSARHPYMFSCGLDKTVKCWDLEQNKVIRSYHGHLSGVYSLALHPELDLVVTGGRDCAVRVWDMRTKLQVHCLSGHDNTVASLLTQGSDPQIISGSHDSTIRLWDLRAGKASSTLTHHKKSVRALALHPTEYAFASASTENVKKFALPNGDFLHNMLAEQRSIVNCAAINADGLMVTGGDNGSLWFWDWRSGHCYSQEQTIPQPGSLESESAIFGCAFDHSGSRLVTVEADKTIKMWKEVENATPESHPGLPFRPPKDIKRF